MTHQQLRIFSRQLTEEGQERLTLQDIQRVGHVSRRQAQWILGQCAGQDANTVATETLQIWISRQLQQGYYAPI